MDEQYDQFPILPDTIASENSEGNERPIVSRKKRALGWREVLFCFVVLLFLILTFLYMAMQMMPSDPMTPIPDVSHMLDASEAFAQESIPEETTDPGVSLPPAEESVIGTEPAFHGWIINSMGYTYLYHGIALEQFNCSDAVLDRYIHDLSALRALIPEGTSVYCMPVPTQIGFLYPMIDAEIRKEDDFYNSSQKLFLDTAEERLRTSMTFVNLYSAFSEAYANGEPLFFRTDHNWTANAAYLAYRCFCKASGNAPVTLEAYSENRIEPFFGSFYRATGSEVLRENADTFCYYTSSDTASCVVTTYSGAMIGKDNSLAANATAGCFNAYSVYLGSEISRVKVESTCRSGKSILIIGDESANALIPFLISNYSEVQLIDITRFDGELSALFASGSFRDVLIMTYATNAVKGAYPAGLAVMAGRSNDG